MPVKCKRCGQDNEIDGDEMGLLMANFICMECRSDQDFSYQVRGNNQDRIALTIEEMEVDSADKDVR